VSKLEDVVLVEVGSVGAGVSTFMLDMREVVDSTVELPKCVVTRIKHESEALARSCRN
jgi:hypothetical protein